MSKQQPQPQPSPSQQPQQPPPPQPVAIGIDLGSYQSVIAVTQRTGIQVLANQANFRQTPNIVGFGPTQRYLGETGKVKLKTNFKDTVTHVTRFLGLSLDSELLEEERRFVTVDAVVGGQGQGHTAFRVNYLGKPNTFASEQIVAALLSKLKEVMQINRIGKEEPVVMSVPGYYNVFERRALLDAAQIAGMRILRLLNQPTAIALSYHSNHKPSLLSSSPHHPLTILFIDFGHSKLSLSVISFTKQKISILAQHHQRNLGCRDIDQLTLQFYKAYFLKTTSLDLNKKATLKMYEAIEKQRKVLSANSEYGMNMEYLMEERDLVYNMRREQFQRIAEPVLARVFAAMQKLKVEIEGKGLKIDGIELFGGGTRIPAVVRLVQQLWKMETSRTINSNQAIAKGCALMSAFKNPNFRPADFSIQQLNYHPIKAVWDFIDPIITPQLPQTLSYINPSQFPSPNSTILFPSTCHIPCTGTLQFNRPQATDIFLLYDPPIPGFEAGIAFLQSPQAEPGNHVFNLELDENGLVKMGECWVENGGRRRERVLVKEVMHKGLSGKERREMAEEERVMVENDRATQQVYELKNKLQSKVYSTKQQLHSTYKQYLTSQQLTNLTSQLDQITNFLYSSSPNSTPLPVLHSKSTQVSSILQSVLTRIHSHEQFHQLLEQSKLQANRCAQLLQDRKYSHIPLRERQAAMIEVEKLKRYLQDVEELQKRAPKNQPLVTSLEEVRREVGRVKEEVEMVVMRGRGATNMRRTEYGTRKRVETQPSYQGDQWRGTRSRYGTRQQQQQGPFGGPYGGFGW